MPQTGPAASDPDQLALVGSRFAGAVAVIVGALSTLLAVASGTASLADTEGTWQALWLVLSVATLTGQATPAGPTEQLTLMMLTVWMAGNYTTLTIGAAVLWSTAARRGRRRRRP